MLITVKARISKFPKPIEKINGVYHVTINEIPQDGKANRKLIRLLSDFFDVSKSSVSIVRGFSSSLKTIRIDADNILKRKHGLIE